jgi:hypothetical protein
MSGWEVALAQISTIGGDLDDRSCSEARDFSDPEVMLVEGRFGRDWA